MSQFYPLPHPSEVAAWKAKAAPLTRLQYARQQMDMPQRAMRYSGRLVWRAAVYALILAFCARFWSCFIPGLLHTATAVLTRKVGH